MQAFMKVEFHILAQSPVSVLLYVDNTAITSAFQVRQWQSLHGLALFCQTKVLEINFAQKQDAWFTRWNNSHSNIWKIITTKLNIFRHSFSVVCLVESPILSLKLPIQKASNSIIRHASCKRNNYVPAAIQLFKTEVLRFFHNSYMVFSAACIWISLLLEKIQSKFLRTMLWIPFSVANVLLY